MKRVLAAAALIAVAQCALGAQSDSYEDLRLICTDSGNLQGSYYMDITGYTEVLNGSGFNFKPTLGFKGFRSWVEPVADLKCRKGNRFHDGPSALIICSTDRTNRTTYEAAIIKVNHRLMMKVRGTGVPAGYQVFCENKEL